jgi:biopolymer transport protein ExbD
MRALSQAHVARDSHGIDLAPMLDFVVNLLIFFIITAVFIKQVGVEVQRPTGGSDTPKQSKSIVVDARGELSIDGKAIDARAVRGHIEQLKAVDAKGAVVIVADEHAPTGAVVMVADEVRLAGITDITFTTTLLAAPATIQ